MEEENAVFYLKPRNEWALEIVEDPLNEHRTCRDPEKTDTLCLRIGLDGTPENPPRLASFGRREKFDDVILGKSCSRTGQCYFDFNAESGELLLHDISAHQNTQLFEAKYCVDDKGALKAVEGEPQIVSGRTGRQCAIVFGQDPDTKAERGWIFQIRKAQFFLFPPPQPTRDEDNFAKKKRDFAEMCATDATYKVTEFASEGNQLSETATATSLPSNGHNLRHRGQHQPRDDKLIRYMRLGPLGAGGQGKVHKVVNKYDGSHYACKTIAVRESVPQLGINSESEFRNFVGREVDLVKKVQGHENIVPYLHSQGFRIDDMNIELFMPVYDGSLQGLIQELRCQKPAIRVLQDAPRDWSEAIPKDAQKMTTDMIRQISDALNYVHGMKPQIIHGDVKPGNILYRGGQFFLADFGLAKTVNTSKERVGTPYFMAPELKEDGDRTSETDIYAFGVTIAECLFNLPTMKDRTSLKSRWRGILYGLLDKQASHYKLMLAEDPQDRPTALECLHMHPQQPTTTGPSTSALPSMNLENKTRRGPDKMDWKHTWSKSISHTASSAGNSGAMGAS
ncbi:kinase-like protein [Nemania abortiva]|nr:kinase-like protein [Nemania abortiva]